MWLAVRDLASAGGRSLGFFSSFPSDYAVPIRIATCAHDKPATHHNAYGSATTRNRRQRKPLVRHELLGVIKIGNSSVETPYLR